MNTTTVFKNGRSQAVRIPKEYRFDEKEVAINKIGDAVLITPKKSKWTNFLLGIDLFSDDFMKNGRNSQRVQKRENL
ncbi:MAG: type II toxin-antitoxin system VapB family antitoxin [Coriobacteriia bacterium]|nr:type II toxin-antitoxin system VapB family antitoxin [Coriobacteriia bacterium]